jgi:hypothetical protein
MNTEAPRHMAASDTEPAWKPKPYTQEQADSIKDLMAQRGISMAAFLSVFPKRPATYAEGNKVIYWLQRQPMPSQPSSPQVSTDLATYKQGGKRAIGIRYALREESGIVKFYRVKPGRKSGFFFVDAQGSDDLYPIKNPTHKADILKRIAADPEAALALYGQEIGACGRCGRTLTSEYRKLGIGPECIKK